MLKKPPDEDVEYLRKTFYDDIPKKTKSYFPMENYGLTEAGYGYVGKLLKFSQPASKEIRNTMTEKRKNTIEAKSRYEKELTSQKKSASAIVTHARRSDQAKELMS